jgi:hypothetical protein
MHPPRGSLRDGEATREAVLDELDWIRSAVTNTNNMAMIWRAFAAPRRAPRFPWS